MAVKAAVGSFTTLPVAFSNSVLMALELVGSELAERAHMG